MKKIFTKEVVIGISVIVAIVILCIGIDYLKGINVFKPANFYVAEYHNVDGLEVAAPVTIDGYKVGQVREINFNYENPGTIEVLLAVNKDLRIPEDSHAVIENTLLSGGFVNIELGKSKNMIEVGGKIQTKKNGDIMSSLTNDILPAVNAVIPKVDTLLLSLNSLVSDPALLQSIRRLDEITLNVNNASQGLGVLLNRQIPGVVGNVNHIVTNIDTISHDLMSLSKELKQLPLAGTMDNVNRITDNLSDFSKQLNSKESTLGLLMNDPELYDRINRIASDVDSLVVDIQKNPKRYISIKLF